MVEYKDIIEEIAQVVAGAIEPGDDVGGALDTYFADLRESVENRVGDILNEREEEEK